MMKLLLISSVVAVALLLLSSGAAGGALTADHGAVDVAVVGGMMLVRHIEDDLSSLEMESAAAYPQPQRRVLQQGINYKPLNANKPACDGNCPAPGNSYLPSRGCERKYQCR
ncbi:hypothetical protein GUJ93_ZPchr0011g28734 [Zizania palustris]|uniref:Uncharacterized protein n=1 Tax=Zizania palustris TaxID=103762 RepID=A0A8J6BPZ6_ZIZPA|nr:hypothetical protein GUJ93_ZPchr0011g28734 [Zizania palustris]KAG8089786.1 hypothetical protein GUJ93_ZPchr0011g28734 [Zizania palustris]